MRTLVAFVFAVGSACGGQLFGVDGGADGAIDHAVTDVAADGWTVCSGPSGAIVCGGPNKCDSACPNGKCASSAVGEQDDTALRMCLNAGAPIGGDPSHQCLECEDGNVCLDPDPGNPSGAFFCGNADYGKLYAASGDSQYVTYADHSTYTGQELPASDTCPSTTGFKLCGGPCGTCPNGYVCVGRSPMHPLSLCVNDESQTPPNVGSYCHRGVDHCDTGRECFTFVTDAPAQARADNDSLCVDQVICEGAAQSYVGGAFCTP